MPLFNENFVSLVNTLDSENWHKDQNSERKKTVNTEVSEIDGFTKLGLSRKKHIKNLFFGHLNVNSLRNIREFLEPLIRNHFDIFLVGEAKLDFSFRGSEFTIPSHRSFRKDRNHHGGALIFYVNQDIPGKTINIFNFPNRLELLPLEINFRNLNFLRWLW